MAVVDAAVLEAGYGAAPGKSEMRIGAQMDFYARRIMLNGLRRPLSDYAWHCAILLVNYLGFLLLLAFVPRPAGMDQWSYNMLIFVKLIVWQHLAEAIGCRQGPLMGHASLPNNYKFRLSRGTLKCTLLPALGNKRNALDLAVHVAWFACNLGFLLCPVYQMTCIRLLCACNVWIFVFDMSQFYASQGHAYGTMLLSACFAAHSGRLAGIQLALIMQYFFAGLGKVGPWFPYVNGPFILQSKVFQGQRWLFKLLLKSEDDLSPTFFGKCVGHLAAGVEYAAPLALMATASGALVWSGLLGLTAMHVYILAMPAHLDVYSWNLCFGLSCIYLFYIGSFGFDWSGAASMSPLLAGVLFAEFCLCWYGQFFPDQVGACLSHRYWAGNWVQCFYLAKRTEAVHDKLAKVKTFSGNPVGLPSICRRQVSVDSDSSPDSPTSNTKRVTFVDEVVAKDEEAASSMVPVDSDSSANSPIKRKSAAFRDLAVADAERDREAMGEEESEAMSSTASVDSDSTAASPVKRKCAAFRDKAAAKAELGKEVSVDSDSAADSPGDMKHALTFRDEGVANAERDREASQAYFYETYSYLWTSTLNMKLFVRLVEDAISSVDGAKSCFDDWQLCSLQQYCCGEFRDPLYAPPLVTGIQEECGFDEGECLMIRIGAFGLGRDSTTWSIHDLKTGVVKEGNIALDTLCQIDSYPSQSLELML